MKGNQEINQIAFSYSSCADSYHTPSQLLTLDENYFATSMNKIKNSNYLIIELKDRFLYPKGYIIRSYKSDHYDFLRSWELYGSLFGVSWTLLHNIESKDDLASGNIGRYSIRKINPFRYFKIVQTGPNNASSDTDYDTMYKMRISYLDFFGIMTNKFIENRYKTCKTTSFFVSHSLLITIILIK